MVIDLKTVLFSALLVAGAKNASAAETVSLQTWQKQGRNTANLNSTNLAGFLELDSKTSFRTVSDVTAKSGAKSRKVAQYFDGLKIIDHSAVIGTDAGGKINRLHGYVARGIEKDISSTTYAISVAQAVDIAKAAHMSGFTLFQGVGSNLFHGTVISA